MFGMTNIERFGMLVVVATLSSACAASVPQPMRPSVMIDTMLRRRLERRESGARRSRLTG